MGINGEIDEVLILIFLENALRQIGGVYQAESVNDVLILIFLENALRLITVAQWKEYGCGLNPYFFGKCSTAT